MSIRTTLTKEQIEIFKPLIDEGLKIIDDDSEDVFAIAGQLTISCVENRDPEIEFELYRNEAGKKIQRAYREGNKELKENK